MSKDTQTLEIDPDDALILLEEALSYYSPPPEHMPMVEEYEDLPMAA